MMIEHKLENNLLGKMTEEENMQLFMDFTQPSKAPEESVSMAVKVKEDPIISIPIANPKKIMYKAQYLINNWDDADV